MALDDIIKDHKKLNKIQAVAQLTGEKGKETDAFDAWVKYCAESGFSNEQVASIQSDQDLQTNLVRRGRAISSELGRKTSDFMNTMNAEYKGAINALDVEHTLGYVMVIPDKGKKYLTVQSALEEGKLNDAKKAFSDLSKNPIWQDHVSLMGESALRHYLPFYVSESDRLFRESKLSDKVVSKKDGKDVTTYVPNLKKIQEYAIKTVESHKSDSQEIYMAYEALAQVYGKFKSKSTK